MHSPKGNPLIDHHTRLKPSWNTILNQTNFCNLNFTKHLTVLGQVPILFYCQESGQTPKPF